MKKIWPVIPLVLLVLVAIFFLRLKNPRLPMEPESLEDRGQTSTQPVSTSSPQPTYLTASFEIYTLGTKRIFTDARYHNLSDDVFISADDPSKVHVKKEGVTWAQFFETLPMSLEKDCLVTGTGQTFCTNDSQTLRFFINEVDNPDALDEVINEADHLLVRFE